MVDLPTGRHKSIAAAWLTVSGDRLITLTHWAYEQNSLVRSLGPVRWVLVTIAALGALTLTWYAARLWRYISTQVLIHTITTLHGVAIASNLIVIFSLSPGATVA